MNVIERISQLKNERGWTDYRLAQEAMNPAVDARLRL